MKTIHRNIILIGFRIYSDYLLPNRLSEYENILKRLAEYGYKSITLREYKNLIDNNNLKGRYFINRHDIDTDVPTAKEFFKIEKKYNARASYYFRLSTLDFDFMREIENYGSEASYHFEEIATFAKRNHIKSKNEIISRMSEIKDMFKKNFIMIEDKLGKKLKTVCSHGDFVNRALGITNNEITNDAKLRQELGILCEAYDLDLMINCDIYISDRPYPKFYEPDTIFRYIGDNNVIYMLTHPRHWRRNIIENTKDNLKRIWEGLIW